MSLKVVHISTSDSGGAGMAAQRIHSALLRQGVESSMLVRYRYSDDPTVVLATPDMNLYVPPKSHLLAKIKKILRRRGKCLSQVERYDRMMKDLDHVFGASYTMPVSNYDLSSHPLVQRADIVHLHWVENFVDYPSFFRKNNKPVIWTFHDENIAYGGFHYTDESVRLASQYALLENDFVKIKRDALKNKGYPIQMVALSSMMERFYHQKAIANDYPVDVIANGVDAGHYLLLDRQFCREALQLSVSDKVIAFCATNINDPHKGLDYLIEALGMSPLQNIKVLCIGSGRVPQCSIPITCLGTVNDSRLLSVAYSAADVFVMPSTQEAFAQAPLEAMACGCPVVAYPVSGTDELINGDNGVRCPDFSIESLAKAIESAFSQSYDREAIRASAISKFDIDNVAFNYIRLYNKCK